MQRTSLKTKKAHDLSDIGREIDRAILEFQGNEIAVNAFTALRTNNLEALYNIELCKAARNGDARTILDFIAAGANVNRSNKEGQTPLHVAVYYHRITTVTALLGLEDIDLKIKDAKGMTALQWARKICFASPRPWFITYETEGMEYGYESMDAVRQIYELLKAQVEQRYGYNAMKNGDLHAARALHGAGMDIDSEVLKFAREGNEPAVRALAATGADIDTALYEAVPEIDCFGNINTSNQIALRVLLAVGANVNKRNERYFLDCNTPLHIAASNGYVTATTALLEAKNVDITIQNFSCMTALELAQKAAERYSSSVVYEYPAKLEKIKETIRSLKEHYEKEYPKKLGEKFISALKSNGLFSQVPSQIMLEYLISDENTVKECLKSSP